MATKLINMYGKTIVCDSVQTLENATVVEHIKTSGVRPIGMAKNTRDKQEEERLKEDAKGYLTQEEYEYFVKQYLKQLPSWHIIYLKQVNEYKMNEYTAYLEYDKAYKSILEMLNNLKGSKPNNEEYDITTLNWGETWKKFYNACTVLDKEIYAIRNEQTIVSATIEYAINESENIPPKWQTAEERKGVWSEVKPLKQPHQVIWASVVYEYAGDVGYSYGTPYIVESGSSEEPQGFYVRVSTNTQVYTRRGKKIQKDILITAVWDEVIPSENWTLSEKSGCELERTDKANVYKLITPSLESYMTDKVFITVKVIDDKKGELSYTVEVSKVIYGIAEITYLGMSASLPQAYIHDGVSDDLINGDWFLSTDLDPNTPLKYGAVYELLDNNNKGLITGWREIDGTKDGDIDKLAKCITDANTLDASKSEGITLLGYAMALRGLTTKNLRVEEESNLQGNVNVNKDLKVGGAFTIGGRNLIDIMYPLGSIYITTNEMSPSNTLALLGTSEWVLVGKNRTLWGAGYEYEETDADGNTTTKTMGANVNIEAGLPNIMGWTVIWGISQEGGAFKLVKRSSYNKRDGGSENRWDAYFDASRGECGKETFDNNGGKLPETFTNNVYGKSDTVQPPALTVYMWKRTM